MNRDLFKLPNVVLTYRGHKTIGGKDTGRNALVVGVTKKVPRSELRLANTIPPYFGGEVTDVIEVGEIKPLNARRARFRPAPGGVSVGHINVTAGTLGMMVRQNSQPMILSNAHVLADVNSGRVGDPIIQPGIYDGGFPVTDTIAALHKTVPIKFGGDESTCPVAYVFKGVFNSLAWLFHRKTRLHATAEETNLVDCAIARPLNPTHLAEHIIDIGVPKGYNAVSVGEIVRKSGRTTELTSGSVLGVDGTARVDYGAEGIAVFEDQIISTLPSQGGDSGSVVVNKDGFVVGLLFAGSPNYTIINKIIHVVYALELDNIENGNGGEPPPCP